MAKVDIKVSELVEKAKRSDLILPEMQWKYVWPARQAKQLNSFLCWKRFKMFI